MKSSAGAGGGGVEASGFSFSHSPQCLHFNASGWISSAQNGHFTGSIGSGTRMEAPHALQVPFFPASESLARYFLPQTHVNLIIFPPVSQKGVQLKTKIGSESAGGLPQFLLDLFTV
jgi:hypothetical protein